MTAAQELESKFTFPRIGLDGTVRFAADVTAATSQSFDVAAELGALLGEFISFCPSVDIFVVAGSSTDVATTACLRCPAGVMQRMMLPRGATHIHHIGSAGTVNFAYTSQQ